MNDRLEEQLRSSLNNTADSRPASAPDLGDVFGRARTIRRRRTALVAGVAAAAVLAVVVPTAVVLSNDGGRQRGLAPATSTPDPTPVSTPTSEPSASVATDSPAGLGIGGVSIGEHTAASYLDPQERLHADGAIIPPTLLTHGGENLTGFTPYHGGWILTYNDNTTAQTGNAGKIVREGQTGGIGIALSSDEQETAFQIDGVVYSGNTPGMSEAEGSWKLNEREHLAGYVGKGPVVSDGQNGYSILLPDATRTHIASEISPSVSSSEGELVGGTTGSPATTYEGAVADAYTGTILWHNEWRPMAFSPDGKYVAAVPVGDNGDPETYAILDARTGTVIAEAPESAIAGKIYLGWQVVWEPSDDSILFQGLEAGGQRRTALFRLTLDGLFNQASEPLKPMRTSGGETSFVLMSR